LIDTSFPSSLPIPTDDGGCKHITSSLPYALSSISLPTTSNDKIDLSSLSSLTILFCYPRTGAPGETIPDEWNSIPGARGCTPQACSFRDLYSDLQKLGVAAVYGVSTQDSQYQAEVKERIKLPFELLSDEKLGFQQAMKLPTIEWQGKTLIKRLTLAIENGKVIKVWYPVFPPDKSAAAVMEWLEARAKGT